MSNTAIPKATFKDFDDRTRDAFFAVVARVQTTAESASEGPWLPDALRLAQTEICDRVAHTIALLLRSANARTLFNAKLPPELVSTILMHLDVHERLQAARICHYWREAALAYPRVWTDLTWTGVADPGLSVALHRSRGVIPIHLEFCVRSKGDSRRIFRALRIHLHHVRKLNISLDHSLGGALHRALTTPAPMLESASIGVYPNSHYANLALNGTIFANTAPLLETFYISNIIPPHQSTQVPALRNVRELICDVAVIYPEQLSLIHSGFPNLERYELDVTLELLPSVREPLVVPAPPSLRALKLPHCYPHVLPSLPHGEIQHIAIGICYGPAAMDSLRELDPGPGSLVLISRGRKSSYSRFALAAAEHGEQGRVRTAREVLTHSHLVLLAPPSSISSHLVSLMTEAHLWAAPAMWRGTILTFPHLELLHLLVRDSALPTCFVTPKLRLLRLSSFPEDCDLKLEVESLLNLLSALAPASQVVLEKDFDLGNLDTVAVTVQQYNADTREDLRSVQHGVDNDVMDSALAHLVHSLRGNSSVEVPMVM